MDKSSQETNNMNNKNHSTTGLNTKDGSSIDDLPYFITDEPVHFNLNDINPKAKTIEGSASKLRPLRDMSQCNPTVNNIELKRKPLADSRNHYRSDNKYRNQSSELVELESITRIQ